MSTDRVLLRISPNGRGWRRKTSSSGASCHSGETVAQPCSDWFVPVLSRGLSFVICWTADISA